MIASRWLLGVLVAGWLADLLADHDADVEAGIEAYEAGEHDEALRRFDLARDRHGDRPELSFDRGLVLLAQGEKDLARTAFQRASEADDPVVRASAFYELGNLELDAENWDAAIEAYIAALQARPDHANAKWNLELALLRKRQQEEEKNEQEQDEQNQEDQNQEDQNQDEPNQDEPNQDESNQDEPNQDEPNQDEPNQDEPNQDEPEPDGQQGEQEQDAHEQDAPQEPPQRRPLDQMDVERALEQLDEQDPFVLDRPVGGYVEPEKDW